MNHILKTVVLSGALALSAMLFGCGNVSPSGTAPAEGQAAGAVTTVSGNVCDHRDSPSAGAL